MNIFFTSLNPIECAQALDDRRLNKMILETAQLLSTATRIMYDKQLDEQDLALLYKPTHVNHPSNLFARYSLRHYQWLTTHFTALTIEKYHRDTFKKGVGAAKHHKSWLQLAPLFNHLAGVHITSLHMEDIEPYVAVDHDIKTSLNSPLAKYRSHLIRKWNQDKQTSNNPQWTSRSSPEWYQFN